MKITITFFLVSVLLFSCDKDNPTPTSSSNPTSSSDTIVYSSYGNLQLVVHSTFSCTIYPTKTVSVNYDRKNQTGSWEKQYFYGVFMK